MTESRILPERQYITWCCLVRASARVPVAQAHVKCTRSAATALSTKPSQPKLTCEGASDRGPLCKQCPPTTTSWECCSMRMLTTSSLSSQLWYTCRSVHYKMQYTAKSRNAPSCALNFGWTSQDPSQLWYTRPAVLTPEMRPHALSQQYPGRLPWTHGSLRAASLLR